MEALDASGPRGRKYLLLRRDGVIDALKEGLSVPLRGLSGLDTVQQLLIACLAGVCGADGNVVDLVRTLSVQALFPASVTRRSDFLSTDLVVLS